MGVIKAGGVSSKAVKFSMVDVEAYAQTVIARAKEQAARLIDVAEQEAGGIRDKRYREGFEAGKADGYAVGLEQGRPVGRAEALAGNSEQLEALVTALADSANKLEVSRRKLETETVYDVIRLSVAIARRVTKKLGDTDPEVAKANVAEALQMVVGASSVRVALHPTQLRILDHEIPEIRKRFPRIQQVELVADPSLSPGGCRLLAGSGIVDADLETQLNRIVADLVPEGQMAPTGPMLMEGE
jgi:flagellar assembly protein FliH